MTQTGLTPACIERADITPAFVDPEQVSSQHILTPILPWRTDVCRGIQDSYKPWSRKNWLNGKSLVMPDPALPAPFVQLAFDDYSFTKGDDMGTYIYALYDHAGYAITGAVAPKL